MRQAPRRLRPEAALEGHERSPWGWIAWLLTGATRVVLLVVGYLCALIPIYAWPFTLFCAFVLAWSRRTRKHAIGMVALTVVINAIVIATVVK